MKKIAIVGSRSYHNDLKIRDVILKAKEKFGDIEIVSGGQPKGADGYAKRHAIELGIKYIEFPPSHYSHNQYCIFEADCYSKPYNVSNFFVRNRQIVDYSDYIIAFISEGVKSNGTMDTVNYAKKQNKNVVIIR